MSNFTLTGKEIDILNASIDDILEKEIAKIREYVNNVFAGMEAEGLDPEKRLSEIASQEKWDRKKSNHGDFGFHSISGKDAKAGFGFGERVFSNLFYHLGYEMSGDYNNVSRCFAPCVVIARAMKEDSRINMFMRAVISAAEKVSWDLNSDLETRERQRVIYRTLKALIK